MDGLKKLNVLLIEDNKEFAKNTIEFLNLYFKNIHHASSIKNAFDIINEYKIDLIISDIKLSDGNGLDFIQTLRDKQNTTAAIILTAFINEKLLLQAIPLNLISYEIKPLSYDGFQNLLKKISKAFKPIEITNITNKLSYNATTKELIFKSLNIALTKKEIIFLEFLIKNRSKVISHGMIQINVWENKFMSNSAIKNLVLRLRKKVNEDFILSVGGVGYRLV